MTIQPGQQLKGLPVNMYVFNPLTGEWEPQLISGITLLRGEGPPSDGIGNNGDYYLDETNFDFYRKENGTWF